MRLSRLTVPFAVLLLMFGMACSKNQQANNVDMKDNVTKALEQADLKDVKVDEDKDKNLITLGGKVRSEDAKVRAADVAKAAAPGRVIANEIAVEPVGVESQAKTISKDVDTAIEKNYHAALVANHLNDQKINFKSKNGVLTLSGSVDSPDDKSAAQQIASSVPNVQQVINELEVKNRGGV